MEYREIRKGKCGCGTQKYWHAAFVEVRQAGEIIVLEDSCAECGHREVVGIPRRDFEAIGRRLKEGSDADGP